MQGLSFLPENIRHEGELVYFDIFPDTTRYPERWEDIFGVLFTEAELSKRRDILDSLWKINKGGQSWTFLEEILQKIDSDIHVFENIPLRNPRDSNVAYYCVCDYENMVCDSKYANCDCRTGDDSFIPTVLINDLSGVYSIPNESAFWEMCYFVCKSVTRNKRKEIMFIERLQIPMVWKNYIEYLILKMKPVQSIAVLFVEWL
jgi:hypothetical protein